MRSSKLNQETELNDLDTDFSWAIYPFKKRTLSWKDEKERIFELLKDMSLYTKTLSELRTR